MEKKVTQLPGTSAITSFVAAVKTMVEELPSHIQFYKIRAQLQREYYLALIEQGFTKEEALELTSKM